MQVNCDDLSVSHTRWHAERTGNLQVLLCPSGSAAKGVKPLAKSDQKCYCRLVGNLLFIRKGIDPVAQDSDYLVVLEACRVELENYPDTAAASAPAPADEFYAFRLAFDFESQALLFRAASESERSAWVTALAEASVFKKIDSAEDARQKIVAITGLDPLKPEILEEDPTGEGIEGGGVQAGGLELELACRSLPPLRTGSLQQPGRLEQAVRYPNAHIEVHARSPPLQEDWAFVGRTDVVENSAQPLFRKTVVIPEGQFNEESSQLRFDIFDVRDRASRTMRTLYSVQASLQQLEAAPELPLAGGSSPGGALPTLIANLRRRSGDKLGPSNNRHMVLLRHLCTDQRLMASNPFKFARESAAAAAASAAATAASAAAEPAGSLQLTVQEFLCDMKSGISVPLQVATQELARLRSLEAALSSLGEHNCPPTQPLLKPLYRLAQAEKPFVPMVSALCQEFAACVEETNRRLFDGDFLKLSRRRHEPQLAFVPPNLQLHRTAVVDSRGKPLDFLDVVTLGAPAAHPLKFKKGGLLSAFKAAPGLEDALAVCEQAASLLHNGSQLCDQIVRLLSSSQQRAAQSSALSSPVPALAADAERVGELVTRLIFLASNYLIVQGRIALELDSVGMQQLNRLLLAATEAVASAASAAAGWEQLRLEVTSVWQQCRLTLARLWLSEASKFPADTLLQCHRRRATAFSQALTAVTCGIAAHFSRWSESAWLQMEACGIPVFMESLLTAYRSECGMLEDIWASVPKVASVTVTFFPGSIGEQPIVNDQLNHVRICVPQQLWDRLSSSLDSLLRGHSFRLVPLLFNVGINEQQTLAETKRVGSLGLQKDINRKSAAGLRALIDQVIRYRRSGQFSSLGPSKAVSAAASQFEGAAEESSLEQSLRDSIQQVELLIDEDRSKPVALLHTVEEIFWLLDGVRLTNCKSGKDRTSMAVTLEQGRWLRDKHRLARANLESTVAFLREHGLRRKNCFRNIGTTHYAFHRVQLQAFPQMYRPPKGTYHTGPT